MWVKRSEHADFYVQENHNKNDPGTYILNEP